MLKPTLPAPAQAGDMPEIVFSEHLARLDSAIKATKYKHQPTEAEALAALEAFDEIHQGPNYPPDYEAQRAALSDALFQASVNECPDCRWHVKAAETRPQARARILAEYHAAGRHDARPVADCANCAQVTR